MGSETTRDLAITSDFDEITIADARGILPDAAGVLDIIADGEEAGQLPPFEALRRAEHPGPLPTGPAPAHGRGRLG